MKKFIVCMLIFSLINLGGCYYQELIVVPEKYDFDETATIYVTTGDTTYKFLSGYNQLVNDTLYGYSNTRYQGLYKLQKIKIPLNKIEKLEVEKIDVPNTCLLSGTIILVIALIIFEATFKLFDEPLLGNGHF